MSLLIGSAVLAFLTWWLADTRLKSEHVRNSEGEITFGRTLSVVLVQIILWSIVFLFGSRIVPHLSGFPNHRMEAPGLVFRRCVSSVVCAADGASVCLGDCARYGEDDNNGSIGRVRI